MHIAPANSGHRPKARAQLSRVAMHLHHHSGVDLARVS